MGLSADAVVLFVSSTAQDFICGTSSLLLDCLFYLCVFVCAALLYRIILSFSLEIISSLISPL